MIRVVSLPAWFSAWFSHRHTLKTRNPVVVPFKRTFRYYRYVILICREINVWRLIRCGMKMVQEIVLCLS